MIVQNRHRLTLLRRGKVEIVDIKELVLELRDTKARLKVIEDRLSDAENGITAGTQQRNQISKRTNDATTAVQTVETDLGVRAVSIATRSISRSNKNPARPLLRLVREGNSCPRVPPARDVAQSLTAGRATCHDSACNLVPRAKHAGHSIDSHCAPGLQVLESKVIEIGGVVRNMSDCAEQGKHQGVDGVCVRGSSWTCPGLEALVENAKISFKGEAFIGTVARVTCNDGYFIGTDSSELECLGSGDAVSGAHWGVPAIGDEHIPTCKQCLKACKTCSDATSCDSCPDDKDVWSPNQKKCVLFRPRSCKDMLYMKTLPAVPAGKSFIDVRVTLYPDFINKPTLRTRATCHVAREPGGEIKAYTTIKCEDLSQSSCIKMAFVDADNTCKQFGYVASPPRSKIHLQALQPLWRDYFRFASTYVASCQRSTVVYSCATFFGCASRCPLAPACTPLSRPISRAGLLSWMILPGCAVHPGLNHFRGMLLQARHSGTVAC